MAARVVPDVRTIAGRVALACSGCGAAVAYLSESKVIQAAAWTGAKHLSVLAVLEYAARAAAVRCASCEARALAATAAPPLLP